MQLAEFTFIITDACNYHCSYCPQKKENKYMDNSLMEKALDFFYPFFKEEIFIHFYGGEPLLAFRQIQHTVTLLNEKNKRSGKKIQYCITTNGSLVTGDILEFFNLHHFSVTISFDGLAHDMGRKKGSFEQTVSIIKKLLKYPGIHLSTNSVFTPETVGYLYQSLRFIAELGVPDIRFSLSIIEMWPETALIYFKDQLVLVRQFLLHRYQQDNTIPVSNFSKNERKSKRIFGCFAGKDRMALTADGNVWGCYRFPDYFKGKEATGEYREFFFGGLDYFIENYEIIYPKILSNYSSFRQDVFFTPHTFCYLCHDVEQCSVCPVSAAFATGSDMLGEISTWECKIQRIQREIVNEFHQRLKS
ncbi:MAG: radical SAM protein [Candidatus Aminicenantes bacterium]|nr:MAG: radical SAM protein [Candidatus Aminicenantes bacterium]